VLCLFQGHAYWRTAVLGCAAVCRLLTIRFAGKKVFSFGVIAEETSAKVRCKCAVNRLVHPASQQIANSSRLCTTNSSIGQFPLRSLPVPSDEVRYHDAQYQPSMRICIAKNC